ncbi:MAG: hypothetical protein SOU53_07970, partial [Oliverpabstia sp.]|nr:hypothetical protein [Oliverpabstia sp.]
GIETAPVAAAAAADVATTVCALPFFKSILAIWTAIKVFFTPSGITLWIRRYKKIAFGSIST